MRYNFTLANLRISMIASLVMVMCAYAQGIFAQDTQPPTFNPPIPMDTTVNCSNVPPPANVTATDTCEPVTIVFEETRTDGFCPGDYELRRVWTASDDCGNQDSIVQIVTVIDTIAPRIINPSQDTTVSCDAAIPPFSVTTSENCSGTSTSYSESINNNTTCPVTRTITRTFTATDLCGNSSSVTQTVTVIDTTAPNFNQQPPSDTLISCDADVPPAVSISATDNCQNATVTFREDTIAGMCPQDYLLRRVWTAVDDCNNADSVIQQVFVRDTTAPVFDSPAPADVTVSCDNIPPFATLTATDNCGTVTVALSSDTISQSCPDEYIIRRVWTASDECGNMDSVEQRITVIDTVAPVFTSPAPADTTVSCDAVPPMAMLTAVDDCSSPTITTEEDTIAGTCPQEYTLDRRWIASDPCGNADTLFQRVNVIDTTAPVFDINPMDTTVNCGEPIPMPSPMATDNCGMVTPTALSSIAPGTCPIVNTISRSWTAEDECGNSATVSQIVTIQDTTSPTITCPSDTTIDCTVEASIANTGNATATDGCSSITITFQDDTIPGNCAGNYTIERTFTAEDTCGNTSTCTQIITVVDTVAPIFDNMAPTDTTVACDATVPAPATLTATDNCSGATVTFSADTTAGACPQEYTIDRMWIATDDCGNSSSMNQQIQVIDTVAPVFDSPAPTDTTVECDNMPMMVTLTATDNCGMVTITTREDTTAGSCPQEYTLRRVWTAEDECGNIDSVDRIINVLDTSAPVFDSPAPADTTVDCDAVPMMATLTATDNCGMVTITTSEDTTAGTCPQEYTLRRVWTAADECGNVDSVEQTINVIDTTAPVFDINPMDTIVDCDAVVPMPSPMATDNCGTVTMTAASSISPGACPNEQVISRSWTAEDECGNSTTLTQTVTIQDTTAPVITCPADITIECTTAADTTVTGSASATDNCETDVAITFSDDTTAGICAGEYVIARTFVADDSCGNLDSCTQTITVIDTVAPVFDNMAPADTTIACDADVPMPATLTATDNCSGATVTYSADTTVGACPQEYTVDRMWVATDECGNSSSMSQQIQIIDTVPPEFDGLAPPDMTVSCDMVMPADSSLGGFDNCGNDVIETFREDTTSQLCSSTYDLRRVWTATDSCGNVDSVVQLISVIDTTPPVFDSMAPADTTVSCDAVPMAVTLTATDNCDTAIVSFQEDTIPGSCPQDYTLNRMWVAEDDCGNTDTMEQTVMVIDTTAPVFDINPADTVVDCEAAVPMPSPMATDNCGMVTMSATSSITQGACPNEFIIDRTWTAEDECGNSTTITQTVTIQDTTAPVITCPADITIECTTAADTTVTGSASATDNCETDVAITFSDDTTAGVCAGEYVIARTFVADDSCGNLDSCTQTITVIDTVAPTFDNMAPADTTIACDATVPAPAMITSTDNCSMDTVIFRADTTAGACPQEFTIRRVWTAQDECGNADSMDQIIVIIDTVAPTFDNLPEADTTIDCNQPIPTAANITATDNCGTATVQLFDMFISGACPQELTRNRIWVASDGCNNTDTVTRLITVQDTFVPVFDSLPPADTTVNCDAVPPAMTLTASDTCGTATVTFREDTSAVLCPQAYTLRRVWTAEDQCGNIDSVDQVVTVQDTTPPVVNCPADLSIDCSTEATTANTGMATASDNCDTTVTITFSDDTTSGICAGSYFIDRTFVAEDDCGNLDSCVQTISVIDTTPPSFVNPPADTTISCDATIPPVDSMLTITDDCSGTFQTFREDTTAGACAPEYTLRRVWTASDSCGNVDSVAQLIMVVDTSAPDFDNQPPADTTIACDATVPSATSITATDNCSGSITVDYRQDTVNQACPSEFTLRRVWTAVDSCGNEDSLVRQIFIVDTVAPQILTSSTDTTISCDAAIPDFNSIVFENCSSTDQLYTVDTMPGACVSEYTIIRKLVVNDQCGNFDSVTQIVTVVDTSAPDFTIPAGFLDTINIFCTEDVPAIPMITAADSCTDTELIFTEDTVNMSCASDYQLLRTWIATDSCDNSDTVQQLVDVSDQIPPFITCPPDTVIDCDASMSPDSLGFAVAIDSCADVSDIYYTDISYNGILTDCGYAVRNSDNVLVKVDIATGNTMDVAPLNPAPSGFVGGGEFVDGTYYTTIDGVVYSIDTTTAQLDSVLDLGVSSATSLEVDPTTGNLYALSGICGTNTSLYQLDLTNGTASLVGTTNTIGCGIWLVIDNAGNAYVADVASDQIYPYSLNTGQIIGPGQQVTSGGSPVDINFGQDAEFVSPANSSKLYGFLASPGFVRKYGEFNPRTGEFTEIQDLGSVQHASFANCGPIVIDSCEGVSTTVRRWFAEDECGNVATCDQIIRKIDTIAPVFNQTLPMDVTVECDNVPTAVQLTATDNCSNATVDFTETVFDSVCTGTYNLMREWVATDDCGNENTHVQIVTVIDTVPPAITLLTGDTTVACDSAVPSFLAFALDNCSGENTSFNEETYDGNCPVIDSIVRTFIATDGCGNADTVTQTILTIDTVAPQFSTPLPADTTIACDAAIPPSPMLMATDNCSGVESITESIDTVAGMCENNFTILRAWSAMDSCGNINIDTQIITVVDTVPPALVGKPDTDTIFIYDGDCSKGSDAISIMSDQVNPYTTDEIVDTFMVFGTAQVSPNDTVSDNCSSTDSLELFVWDMTFDSTACTSTVTVNFRLYDDCGNYDSLLRSYIFVDTIPPVITWDGMDTVEIECASQMPDFPTVMVVDSCDVTLDTMIMTIDSMCVNQKTVMRSVVATDECGFTDTVSQKIIITDTISPMFVEMDETVMIECAFDEPAFPSTEATDNCGIATIDTTVTVTDSNCVNQYTKVRQFVALDSCGNSDTLTQTIIVTDTTAPTITSVPADITIECDDPVPADEPTATDNCQVINIDFSDGITPGACPQEYTITRTFTVSDECGNSVTAQRVIEVVDTTLPFLISSPMDMTLSCEEEPPFTPPVVEDNCDPDPSITFEDTYVEDPSCPQGGRIDRVFTISDACGNSYVLLQQFYFIDTEAPEIDPVHPDLIGVNNGETITYQCFAQDPDWELQDFDLDDFEFSDNCSEDVVTTFTKETIGQGNCPADGYLARVKYTVTADDQCGNVTTYEFFVELIDEVPPVLFGVPNDVTIDCDDDYEYPTVGNCEATADVYGEDECECVDLVESRDTIAGSCSNEYTVVVSYEATDNCGNSTTASYTITVEDNRGPSLIPRNINLLGVASGSELEVNCVNSNFPQWALNIGPNSIIAADNCGGSILVDYDTQSEGYNDCFDQGALGYTDHSWTFVDECGNYSTYEVRLILVDKTAPVIHLENEVICETDTVIYPEATDNCGMPRTLDYEDIEVVDECSGERIIERTWTAVDYCGNISTAVQKLIAPQGFDYEFTFDLLAGLEDGDEIDLECTDLANLTPSEDWIKLDEGCYGSGEVLEVTNSQLSRTDSCENGQIGTDQWTWVIESVCGEVETIEITVNVFDETAPMLVDFSDRVTIACGEDRPEYEVLDVCDANASVEEIRYELVSGDTCQGRVFERVLLTTDICGNEREYTQTINVTGDMGPTISGIPDDAVCSTEELAEVSAFDECANMEVDVTFEDVSTEPCATGTRTLRVYSATSMCGTERRDSVYILEKDDSSPEYEVVGEAVRGLEDGSIVEIECNDSIRSLTELDLSASDVIFNDACDPSPEVTFSDRYMSGNCDVDGYLRARIATWEATDACGNSTEVRIEFRLVNQEPPEFIVVPDDVTILCEDEYEIEEPIVSDDCQSSVEVRYEDSAPISVPEGTLIIRTWIASDGCGNENTIQQRIVYDSGDLTCNIEGPRDVIDCDEDNVRLSAAVQGGLGPYQYEWIVTGGVCEIEAGQGTANVIVDVAFSDAQLTLMVTDQLGCVTSCVFDIVCDLGESDIVDIRQRDKREYNLYQNYPNPFEGVTTIGFSLPEKGDASLRVYDAAGKNVILEIEGEYNAGYNEIDIRRTDVPSQGVYYYELTSGEFKGVKRMVIMD